MKKPDGTKIVSLNTEDPDILMDIFDKTNVAEVMKKCLEKIYPLWAGDRREEWLIQRINDYVAVENFEIATDLLQRLTLAKIDSERTDEQEKRIFDLTLEIINLTRQKYDFRESLGKALNVLSTIIRYHPSLYNDKRLSMKDFLIKYQESMSSKDYNALSAILRIIVEVKDSSLIEDLEKLLQTKTPAGLNPDYLDEHGEYYNFIGRLTTTIIAIKAVSYTHLTLPTN